MAINIQDHPGNTTILHNHTHVHFHGRGPSNQDIRNLSQMCVAVNQPLAAIVDRYTISDLS